MNLYYLIVTYFIFALISIITKESKNKYHIIVKPLSLMILIFYYTYKVFITNNWSLLTISGLAALICGALGDIFLSTDEKYFFQGLISFLIGHIFYIISFYKPIQLTFLSAAIIIIIYGLTLSTIILLLKFSNSKYRNIITLPVLIYTTVLTTMFIFVSNYSLNINYLIPLTGALLFILSDTILTIHIFVKKLILGSTMILLTYYTAQLFLFFGLLNFKFF